jgi:hypothetical protein
MAEHAPELAWSFGREMHSYEVKTRRESGNRVNKTIANWWKVTYNEWFFSELWPRGEIDPHQFFH